MKVVLVWILLGCFSEGGACLWDRDTQRDELANMEVGIYRLLIGAFSHHGDAYYEARLRNSIRSPDLDDKNDSAVALIRMGKVEEGIEVLEGALEENPGHYPSLSNMGVANKKRGEFEVGAKWIELALAKNPEGHMGLGDWYLKMLRWRAEFEKGKPEVNFLGDRYDDIEMLGGRLLIPPRYSGGKRGGRLMRRSWRT